MRNLAKKGFTLIELLVVIAIIGILAAIILPVYSQAKKSAYRSADMSNMNQLRTALGLYKVDQGAYPPSLLGYVTEYTDATHTATEPYDGGAFPDSTNLVPANVLAAALYPKRVNSLTTFTPALDRPGGNIDSLFVNPVWPNGNIGTAVGAQRFGPTTNVEHCDDSGNLIPSLYYEVSGYDVANVKTPTGTRNEIHYANFWSVSTVPSTCNPSDAMGDPNDAPNQLGYSDPPDSTVVTWDSFFRDYDSSGNPVHQKQDLVLFLGGDARPYDSADVAAKAWQVTP